MGIMVKCKHCGYEWSYEGKKKVLCTCPDCMRRINIEECRIDKKKEDSNSTK